MPLYTQPIHILRKYKIDSIITLEFKSGIFFACLTHTSQYNHYKKYYSTHNFTLYNYFQISDTRSPYSISASGKFRLIQRDDFIKPSNEVKQRDALFSDEFVFALFSTKVDAFYTSCCYPASTFTKRFRVRDIASIFGTEVNDFRYMLTEQDEGNSQHILLKKHHADYENSKQKFGC